MRQSRNFGIKSEYIIDLVLFAAPVAIIFARLYYVAFTFNEFRYDLTEIFRIWHGGLAIYGALIGACLVAWIYAKVRKIDPLRLFDLAAPYIVLAQAIGRWGNFINQEAYGYNTKLPWGMTGNKIRSELLEMGLRDIKYDFEVPVHPTFLYESLWNIGVFLFLIWFRKRRKLDGELFFLYLILYGAGRFWVEGLRTDSLMIGNFRISQLVAALCVIGLIILFFYRRSRKEKIEQDKVGVGESEFAVVLDKMKDEKGTAPAEDDSKG
ncbi:MAG: prolipoprotein diacylglyceryl transferase, partial [Eubacteriales bacterium]|nr:prolipoprotein diacylglyceryl transferase [Eubacteriales bacterium]